MRWSTANNSSLVLTEALVDNACESLSQPVGHGIATIALLAVQEHRCKYTIFWASIIMYKLCTGKTSIVTEGAVWPSFPDVLFQFPAAFCRCNLP